MTRINNDSRGMAFPKSQAETESYWKDNNQQEKTHECR